MLDASFAVDWMQEKQLLAKDIKCTAEICNSTMKKCALKKKMARHFVVIKTKIMNVPSQSTASFTIIS
jgi:hypothetical protein